MPTKVTITVEPLYSVLQWRVFSKVSGVEMHARVVGAGEGVLF